MSERSTARTYLWFGIKLLLSAGMLGFVLWLVDPTKVWEAMGRADVPTFLLFFPLFGIVGLIGAIRWRLLLTCQEIDISLWEALKLTLLGYFFGLLPTGLAGGDLAKAIYASKNTPHRARAAMSVIVDRMVGTVALGIIGLTGMLIWYDDPIAQRARIFVIIMTVLVAAICAVFLFGRAWGMDRLAERFPLGGISSEILKARDYYWNSKRTLLATLGISFFGHFGCMVLFYGFGLSLGATSMGFTDYILAVPTISFISCLPISSMGLGVGELSTKWLFEAKGVSENLSVAISLMYRISLFAWSSLGGVVAVFYRSRDLAAQAVAAPDAAPAQEPEG